MKLSSLAALGFVISALVLPPGQGDAAPNKSPVVCVAQKNGAITVKSKCTRRETRLSESSYSEGRTTILNVAHKGAKFTTLSAALNAAISLSPTASNPVLVKIGPGRFNEGDSLTVPSFVTVEGAGIGGTIIRVTSLGIFLLSSSNLRQLTLEHNRDSAGTSAIGVISGSDGASVENVEIKFIGAGRFPTGIASQGTNVGVRNVRLSGGPSSETIGILAQGGSIDIDNVEMNIDINSANTELENTSGIIVMDGAIARIRNSIIKITTNSTNDSLIGIALYGAGTRSDISGVSVNINGNTTGGNGALYISNQAQATARNSAFSIAGFSNGVVTADDSATVTILNSDVIANSDMAPVGAFSNGSISVGSSRLSGAASVANTGGTLRCAAVYDEDFNFSANSCP